MKNEVWEKILQYLNQLRGEQKSRNSTVHIPGMAEVEKDMTRIREECGQLIEALPESEKQKFEKWFQKAEELNYMQEQQAYCQGYVDCVFLLFGLGLLKQDALPENFMENLQK